MFVSHNIVDCDGGCLGYHDVLPLGGGMEQTYVYASYNDQAFFTFPLYGGEFEGYPDINTLSHEVSEWVNDPFGDNIVPAWSDIGDLVSTSCSYTSYLEVGDPLENAVLPKRVLKWLAASHVIPRTSSFFPGSNKHRLPLRSMAGTRSLIRRLALRPNRA